MDEQTSHKIISAAKHIADAMKASLGATGVNLINASGKDAEQSVPHFHLHLVPRFPDDGLAMNDRRATKVQEFTMDELKNIANKITETK